MGKKRVYNDTFIKFAEEQYRKEYSLDPELKSISKDHTSNLAKKISSRIRIFLPFNIFMVNGKLIHISYRYEGTEEEKDRILEEIEEIEKKLCDNLLKYEEINNKCEEFGEKEKRTKEYEKLKKRKLAIGREIEKQKREYIRHNDEAYGWSWETNIYSQCGEDEIALFNILLENIPAKRHADIKILEELSEDVRFDILMRMKKLCIEKEKVWGILDAEWEEMEAKVINPQIYEMNMYIDRVMRYKPEDIMIHVKEFKMLMSALKAMDKELQKDWERKHKNDSAEKIVESLMEEKQRRQEQRTRK